MVIDGASSQKITIFSKFRAFLYQYWLSSISKGLRAACKATITSNLLLLLLFFSLLLFLFLYRCYYLHKLTGLLSPVHKIFQLQFNYTGNFNNYLALLHQKKIQLILLSAHTQPIADLFSLSTAKSHVLKQLFNIYKKKTKKNNKFNFFIY